MNEARLLLGLAGLLGREKGWAPWHASCGLHSLSWEGALGNAAARTGGCTVARHAPFHAHQPTKQSRGHTRTEQRRRNLNVCS